MAVWGRYVFPFWFVSQHICVSSSLDVHLLAFIFKHTEYRNQHAYIYTYLLMGAGLGFSSSNTNLQFSGVRHTRMKENVERRERKKKKEAPNCHGRASSVNQPSHLSTIFKRRASYFRQASVTLKYYFVKKTEALEGWVWMHLWMQNSTHVPWYLFSVNPT